MSTLKFIVSTVIISSLLMSCGNPADSDSEAKTETQKEQKNTDHSQSVQLNNGEKWPVNEEMKPFILEAELILTQYTKSKDADYPTLAKQLKEKNSRLIKSCTMKGESHDELHKWLVPHIALIEDLSESETTEEATKVIADLQASFSTYNQYFQ